jgi:GNAT superfamily N-acetyltransferase
MGSLNDDRRSSLALRLMTRKDLAFADHVRALAGWNQTLADWDRFLALAPEGCFIADRDGRPAGIAITTVYGADLAWIGMVLVHPDYRRQGIGQALMKHCIQYARERGVRCIKLDATPLGKKVYDNLGFASEWTLSRWMRTAVSTSSVPPDTRLRPWQPEDEPLIEVLDSAAFGVSRRTVIQALARQSLCGLVFETAPGQIAAYGLLRSGAKALYLGPVVAIEPDLGVTLINALLASCQGQPVFWDIPDQNDMITAWARQTGFIWQRSLTRMMLGDTNPSGNPRIVIALAGPEIG